MIMWSNLWRISSLQVYLASLLGLSAVAGDLLVNYSQKHIYRALFDNVTHAVIGGLSWFIICLNHRERNASSTLFEIITCTAVSSLIDLDHFAVAKSWSLKDATSLKYRPPLHVTTIPLVIVPSMLYLSYLFHSYTLQRYSLILFTAFITHHTRDATRRGYWFYPFGATPAIPYFSYVLITLSIPYLVCGFFYLYKIRKLETHNIDV
ncbi:hypothetical protein AMK59_4205 [Oryctes borbonicus]|uniref:Transmembrane protein 267 n=1 Tax=Oryctes borbonicus TaxID=1629725 RepID=A0A0T6B5Z1_9SCAR|nr:hypothetical protein AMK59_4205 [Oryctes borbonicus]